MGARAKRRLAIGTVATLVTVGAVIVFVIARSGSSSHSGSRSHNSEQTSKEVYGTFGTFGVAYGVHGSQLRRRFGAPDQKRGGCWIYHIRAGAFHGIKLIPQIAGMDAVRYCFYSGVITTIEDHWRPGMHSSPQPESWTAPVTYGCGGGPCKVQDIFKNIGG
jgi:hypothetical protein